MYIVELKIEKFRNYDYLTIDLAKGTNLFYGENSSGKTNIIEAIYYMSFSKSFRCNSDKYLIKNGNKFFKISIIKEDENKINKCLSVEYNSDTNKKIFKENKKSIKKISDLLVQIPLILFSPEDIYMIKGEPQLRRRFIDSILIKTDKEYYFILNKFNKIVSQRNLILKSIKEHRLDRKSLDVWNQQLKEYSIKIINTRKIAIEKINKIIFNNFRKENINIYLRYNLKSFLGIDTSDINNYFELFFEKKYFEEVNRTLTLIGPHRDDIEIYLNNNSLKYYGSEGQQRLSCIILKLAEGIYIKEKNNVYPIVLLDDFTSELDETNKCFVGKIFNIFKQIIITTTNRENVKNIKIDKYFLVANGNVMDNDEKLESNNSNV